jgi:hypothetical protein
MGLHVSQLRLEALALGLVVGLAACGTSGPPGPDRGSALAPGTGLSGPREQRSTWARTPEPEPTVLPELPPAPDIVIEQPAEPPPVEAAPEPAAPPRDLGEELRQAIGGIDGCLDAQTAAALGGSLSVGVRATALPSGRLQRASVSASSLPQAARDCIRDRVEAASMPTPIPGAPRSVSTTLRFEVSASVTTEQRRTLAPETTQLPTGAHAPGRTLPALAPAGPAPGAVAPGRTLPAQAPSGPAPGAVAPGITLPAQGATPRR